MTNNGVRSILLRDGAVVAQQDADTHVPWWSVGKTIIASAATVLLDRRALALDAPLAGRPYTLRHLLQHTSGLPDYGGLRAYHDAVARGDPPWPIERVRAEARANKLLFAPGSDFAYSNIGYREAADLVTVAAGMPLADALSTLVLAPAGAATSRLAITRADLAHVEMGNAAGYDPGWVYHGLVVGPLREAALTIDAILAGRLFCPALLSEMMTVRSVGGPIPGRPWTNPGYGLGIMSGRWGTLAVSGHTGGGPGSVNAVYTSFIGGHRFTAATFSVGPDGDAVEHACAALLRSTQN